MNFFLNFYGQIALNIQKCIVCLLFIATTVRFFQKKRPKSPKMYLVNQSSLKPM